MRRRERPDESAAVPERLCRYIRSEWPGDDPLQAWTDARLAFIRAHGSDTPIGDLLDVLREHRRLVCAGGG